MFSLNQLYSWFKPTTCCNASQHYSRPCHCTEDYQFLLQLLTWLWEEWLLFQGLHRQTLILVLLYLAYLGTIDPTNLFNSISYFLILCKDSSGVLHINKLSASLVDFVVSIWMFLLLACWFLFKQDNFELCLAMIW